MGTIRKFVRPVKETDTMYRVDVVLEAAQHYAYIEPDLSLVDRLLDAARAALLEGSLWVDVGSTDASRVQAISDSFALCDLITAEATPDHH